VKEGGARHTSGPVTINTGDTSAHRDLPQRGSIDEAVDRYLDGVDLSVQVVKQGRVDGVYVFGARIMRTELEQHKIFVVNGKKKTEISTYIFQFEKTEMLRARGLDSAMQAMNVINVGVISMQPIQPSNNNNTKKKSTPTVISVPQATKTTKVK